MSRSLPMRWSVGALKPSASPSVFRPLLGIALSQIGHHYLLSAHPHRQIRGIHNSRRPDHSKQQPFRRSQSRTAPDAVLESLRRQEFKRKVVVWSFWAINGLVFFAWIAAKAEAEHNIEEIKSQPRWQRATQLELTMISPKMKEMLEKWTSSRHNLEGGRYYTLLTAAVSHQDFFHLLFNMVTFNAFMTVALYSSIPLRTLAGLTVGSAVVGNLSGLADHERKGQVSHYGLGASTINMGLASAMACTQPFVTFAFFGVVPMKLWQLAIGFTALDMYMLDSKTSSTGHAAHLGGAVFGLVFYFARLRKFGGLVDIIRYYATRSRK
ncbi:hypothetical protein BKA67DRAFT_661356 [Truncatella angustata]|uniref:Peptidase S54 rhomboid domain-containing protein n=1 Tax=Truncatella angustata TaxID=152316 RepID=A0A9P8UEB3_9PEZI|nr:uncharacterized protein BKA67DRAFT_661356 [Truncatella angustata]KAH6648375.1 hypothetical protein BKA67DRAFT_661356 [Truncatella angustata]KAH8204813.1 hypothetical protein TruAng_001002 [Truncatella angustata]